MSLASVIRLEFAYPGVGILAGDSLQYLSIATAHGVIMVFFMIMPAIFGGFGNFLLPTQLGVHDVAFPRLNSAAFWFLPGGLIMLMQLVCVDRRYQRMNCFNIRELQGVLKRKFFTDLVNTNDHRDFLNQSMIGLRFKTNNQLSITPDIESFFNLGTTNNTKSKTLNFNNSYYSNNTWLNSNLFKTDLTQFFTYNVVLNPLKASLVNIISLLTSFNPHSFPTCTHILTIITSFFNANLIFAAFDTSNISLGNRSTSFTKELNVTFSTENTMNSDNKSQTNTFLSETSNNARFTRFNNPLISYDYKCGHYLGI
jgi:hypothetical protein